ncbi:MAG: DUF5674 family protein [Candidatus Margulisiibacteriota bacterium]
MTDLLIFEKDTPISVAVLQELAEKRFGDMVKGVIDIETETVVLGAELHADEEAILIQKGHAQAGLWGFNIYLDEDFPANIEFDSMINIRPSQGNRSRLVEDVQIRDRIIAILEGFLK